MKAPSKTFAVGLKRRSGQWEIKLVNINLDPGDNFRPCWPMKISWPDGIEGYFMKASREKGRMLYSEV